MVGGQTGVKNKLRDKVGLANCPERTMRYMAVLDSRVYIRVLDST